MASPTVNELDTIIDVLKDINILDARCWFMDKKISPLK
jgi:hypothetical protein